MRREYLVLFSCILAVGCGGTYQHNVNVKGLDEPSKNIGQGLKNAGHGVDPARIDDRVAAERENAELREANKKLKDALAGKGAPPPPAEKTEDVLVGSMDHMPPRTRGDDDWDEGFNCWLKAQSEIQGNTIRVRVFMKGEEREPDHTTVEGWSDWRVVFTAPSGWKILGASPLGETSRECGFGENEDRKEIAEPQGQVASRFVAFGFRGDNPHTAGSYTRVTVDFSPIKVRLQESR